jgi:hypothetical protein
VVLAQQSWPSEPHVMPQLPVTPQSCSGCSEVQTAPTGTQVPPVVLVVVVTQQLPSVHRAPPQQELPATPHLRQRAPPAMAL